MPLARGQIKGAMAKGNGRQGQVSAGGEAERGQEREGYSSRHAQAFLASFLALFPSLNSRKKLSALIQTPPSFSPPGSWSGPRGK